MTLSTRSLQLFICFCTLTLNCVNSQETIQQSDKNLSCNTKLLLNTQRQWEQYIDVNEKPCDDFWEYACGNWHPSALLRFAEPRDTLSMMKASNKYLLLQYLDEVERLEEGEITKQPIHQFYKSCLYKSVYRNLQTEKKGIRDYTDILKNISANWPLLQKNFNTENLNESFMWEQVSAEMRKYGAQTLFSTKIQSNWQNSQQLIFYILPPSFQYLKARQSDVTADPESEFLYKRYIKLLLMDLGIKVRKANQIAEQIIDFEKSLMSLVNNERLFVLKKPQTLSSLVADIKDIDFLKYFQILMENFDLPQNYEDIMLIVADHRYLKNLSKLLKHTDTNIMAKYFMIQFLIHFKVNLFEEYSFIKLKEECLMQINEFMPSELTLLYLQLKHGQGAEFLQKTEKYLMNMFNNLKLQFEKLINTTTVFERDPATKILSREKLRAMRLLLPTLDTLVQEEQQFEIDANYHKSLINLSKLKVSRELNKTIPHMVKDINSLIPETKISLSSLNGEQSYGPLDVNAYYRLKKNAIELPIGILQAPLYDECSKPAQNYGGLGAILAHEILHGFDYDGLNYDKLGNVANSWGIKAIIKFGVKSNCYLNERYNNGHIKINENLADSEGLRLSLETFLESELNEAFDPEDLKLFFLSFGQTWCGESSKDNTAISMHASHRERVNNVLGNFMEFADVYKCKPGEKMHPEEKCRVW